MSEHEKKGALYPSATHSVRLKKFVADIIKSYLIKLFYNHISPKEIQCKQLYTLVDESIISYPNIISYNQVTKAIHTDNIIFGVITYKNREFLISFSPTDELLANYYLHFITELPNEIYFNELYNKLLMESISSIDIRGKIVRFIFRDDEFIFDFFDNFPQIFLKDMVLPEETVEDLWDFIYAVAHKKVGLRYLFVGEAGTGKTDTMIAIINEIMKLTNEVPIIIIESIKDTYFEYIFRLLNYFEIAVICFDDLDLIINTRRESKLDAFDMVQFLHNLDGLYLNDNISIIATTNSRDLIDLAIRRPGRFDLIIEFKLPKMDDYVKIIRKITDDERILEIFTNKTVQQKLSSIKATGAFLVTLVKHLKNPKYSENLSVETVLKVIDKLYKSFKPEIKTKTDIGFEP